MSWNHNSVPSSQSHQVPAQRVRVPQGIGHEVRQDQLFDHFNTGAGAMNSQVPQPWVTTETGAATPFVANATAGSYAVGVCGATTNNAEELAGKKVGWNPSTRGGLTFECRLKSVGTTTATDGDFYFGLADAVTYTNSLPYVISAASALTTTVPSNFAGFAYTSIASSGALYNSAASGATGNFIGILTTKADVDVIAATASAATGAAVAKDSSFHIYRIEMDASGNAWFYIDDIFVGYVAVAFTANTEMTPYFNVVAKNSHAQTMSIDYIRVDGQYV